MGAILHGLVWEGTSERLYLKPNRINKPGGYVGGQKHSGQRELQRQTSMERAGSLCSWSREEVGETVRDLAKGGAEEKEATGPRSCRAL